MTVSRLTRLLTASLGYRFATKLEIFLNIIGIVCAVAAGAAQVCMCVLRHSLN